MFKVDFPKFYPKFGKIPKFAPFSSKVGKNLGESWENEKGWEEEIFEDYSLVYFQYQQKYIFENCFGIYGL